MKKRYRKARLFLLDMAVLSVSIVGVHSIYAYFTHQAALANQVTIGENTIVPEEPFDPPSPGEKTVKEPRAVNTGKTNCYVRAKVLLSDSRVQSFLTCVNEGNTGEGLWIKNKDGWLYYDRILETSKKTEPIFTHIITNEEIPEELKDFSIDVLFESVQAEGFKNAEDAFAEIKGTKKEVEEAYESI